jgi:PKD repeat protein
MKTAKRIAHITLAVLFLFSMNSCKKDKAKPAADIFYTFSLDGYTVTFTNETTGAVSYKWDFGDGETSTEESPVHTYPGKGKYVPTLYATTSDGITTEGSTVIHISKSSAIKLDDNSLADWDTVTHNIVVGGPDAGNFRIAKYDYDAENIYFYFEQNAAKSDGDIYDFYIDADNDISTGYLTGDYPNGGFDVLLEGTVFDEWLDPYYHSGDQASFDGYAYQSINEFYLVGTVKESGGVLKFEGALKRNKIKGLTGNALKIGVEVFTNDFGALIGYSPDLSSNAFFLDMSE